MVPPFAMDNQTPSSRTVKLALSENASSPVTCQFVFEKSPVTVGAFNSLNFFPERPIGESAVTATVPPPCAVTAGSISPVW